MISLLYSLMNRPATTLEAARIHLMLMKSKAVEILLVMVLFSMLGRLIPDAWINSQALASTWVVLIAAWCGLVLIFLLIGMGLTLATMGKRHFLLLHDASLPP